MSERIGFCDFCGHDFMTIDDAFHHMCAGKMAVMYPQKSPDTENQVIADILRRQLVGLQKYGTTVADNPLPLREWLQHAYEECLDQAIYLRRAMQEMDAMNESCVEEKEFASGQRVRIRNTQHIVTIVKATGEVGKQTYEVTYDRNGTPETQHWVGSALVELAGDLP